MVSNREIQKEEATKERHSRKSSKLTIPSLGRANDNDQLPESAARLHNHQQTEAVIVVGVGKRIVKEELNIIANGKTVRDFAQLVNHTFL